jgi:NAD(P)-dependent dehydrogenase (short-subunit alcohol dehydrogenase family)
VSAVLETARAQPIVIVTGAAGGIGSALVVAFEAAGWRVVSVDLKPLPRPDHVVGDIAHLSNPSSESARELVAALAHRTEGHLKAVVHNAATQILGPASQLTEHDWSQTLNANLLGPFGLSMAFREELQANGGSVLAISSIHERLTKPGFVAYATSKAALSAMMRALAIDMGGAIRFNAICPAAIHTPMLAAGFDGRPEDYARLERHHPSGRVGQPHEVAAAAVFMCSDACRFMNGSCVEISGGIGSRLHDPV